MDRKECNQLLLDRGFHKKDSRNQKVPEEVLNNLRYKRADEL